MGSSHRPEEMPSRIVGRRLASARLKPRLAPLADQGGMFAMLPLSPEAVLALRTTEGIDMARETVREAASPT